ncbi:MAG: ATP-binding protein [Burkholderiales bacterium]|nr:ATP-binding protein [Burkholderiales bacterium]
MITRIEATRYRCLELLEADLQPYGVLVGANGSGKTTFLDIPGLLADCLQVREIAQAFTGRLHDRPPRSATLNELIFAGQGTDFLITLEVELPQHVISALLPSQTELAQNYEDRWLRFLRYEIRFEIFNDRELVVGNEYLFLFSRSSEPERGSARLYGETARNRDWRFIIERERKGDVTFRAEARRSKKGRPAHIDSKALALTKVQFETADDHPAARWFYDYLTTQCVFYRPNIDLLQTASPPGLSAELMLNAANLPWLVLELQNQVDKFNAWVEHVKTALPQVTAIRAKEREEDHHAYLAVTYNGGYEVTSSGLSEGTLRILAMTILPYLMRRPALIMTEEPENGIHPRAIEAVLQSLQSIYGSQVLISSHSPVVLAASKLGQVLCARLEANGASNIVRGPDHPRLSEWHGQLDLGSLFAAGILG